jgi:hypothetical protein
MITLSLKNKKKMDTINFKNYQLNAIIKILSYPMPFYKGRVKNRFMSLIMEKAQALEKNRLEILMGLCKKDKDGNPITKNDNYELDDKNRVKWSQEYAKMMGEDCLIDVTPSLKVDLGPIKDLINSSSVELDNQETAIIEEVVTALEIVKPKSEEKKETKKKK